MYTFLKMFVHVKCVYSGLSSIFGTKNWLIDQVDSIKINKMLISKEQNDLV